MIQIRVEKETTDLLGELRIERRETYNDVIRRLVKFWNDNQGNRP